MSNIDLLEKAFSDTFPATTDQASIEYIELAELAPGSYAATIRLICWETNERGVKSIRDIREQQLPFKLANLDLATIGRVREFLAALVRVLVPALAHPSVETLMPNDLVDFSPLKLARSSSEDDFVRALSVPSRLGQYLPIPT